MDQVLSNVQSTFLNVAGRKTQLTRGGSGAPLLYLHSVGGETEWFPFFDALARQHEVLIPAHPGFALSEADNIEAIPDIAWHYVDLLEQLELSNVPVVGFSLGGWIALELAILRPHLVGKIVLVASAGLYLPHAPIAELFAGDLEYLRDLLFHDPEDPVIPEAMPTTLDDPRMMLWLRSREAAARVAWNPYLHNPRLAEHLKRVTCPTHIVWGESDRVIPPAHGQFFADHIEGSTLSTLPECGHMVPYEKRDQLAAEVLAFVK